jgi:Beta propeller domain
MKSRFNRFTVLARQAWFLFIAAFAFASLTTPIQAAEGSRKLLKMELSEDKSTAMVKVPDGYQSVTLQQFDRKGGWRKVATKNVNSKVVRFKLPSLDPSIRWRVLGRFENRGSREKFPAAFYKGDSRFGSLKTGVGGLTKFGGVNMFQNGADPVAPPESGLPEEADIWKSDKGTLFFFNQLRGLQVLDVTKPGDPRLTASLRLPAAGEDLYLLDSAGPEKHLVLLTRKESRDGEMTRINLVKVDAGKIEITQVQDVPGSLADSRMVGERLILATSSWETQISPKGNEIDVSTSTLSQWSIKPGQISKENVGFAIEGDNPLISAGADWLAVAVTPTNEWRYSMVTVFGLGKTGLVSLNHAPIRTAGVIADKFKMQWRNNVLTTISEKNRSRWDWAPITVLENFRVWGDGVIHPAVIEGDLGKLELAKGESLFGTRFDGDKAYVVTFLQTDPLWIVDLTDPKKPVVSGHLEVPGWSSHLEPLGDHLLSIGWESDTVAASLFDVKNPAVPKLLRRLNLGSPGAYSEAAWDEKALKVLADEGLVMVPVTSYDAESGESESVVQLIDLDLSKGDLVKRGAISHEFDARRSDLIGDAVISISQRVLVAADVSDRDKPTILSEVSLAWPVDRVLDGGTHLLQIESGGGYGQSRATVRVSASHAPESVFSEFDLGKGTVRGSELRDGKLYILRETTSFGSILFKSAESAVSAGKLVLDIYDATSLPDLVLLGSVSQRIQPGLQVAGSGLLWPRANRPSVVLDAQSTFWYWDRPIVIDLPRVLKADASVKPGSLIQVDRFPSWRPQRASKIVSFDITDTVAPRVGDSVAIGTNETVPNGFYQAADGLVVIGTANWKNESTGEKYPIGETVQAVHVVEVPASGSPVVRPGIDLPGELFSVSQLDAQGFLAFTRQVDIEDAPGIKVSACDGFDAFEIAGLDGDPGAVAVSGGRRLFVAGKGGVARYRLTDAGAFETESFLATGWSPNQLRWTGGILIGSKWNALFAAAPDAEKPAKWRFPAWSLDLEQVNLAQDGDLLVPFGEYGAERLGR